VLEKNVALLRVVAGSPPPELLVGEISLKRKPIDLQISRQRSTELEKECARWIFARSVEKRLVIIMQKLALLLAAALMASAPVVAAMTTDGYAAAKKAKRVAKAPPAPEQIGPKPPFADIVRAIDDLGRELGTYRHVYDPAGGGDQGGKKAAKKAR
jgi:hypothetical protein